MSKFCKNCGTELADDAVFCKNCGQSTASQEAPTEAAPEVQACGCDECNGECVQDDLAAENETGVAGAVNGFIGKVKNKDKNALLIVGGAVLALILIVVLVFVFSGSSSKDAIDNYFNVVVEGNIDDIEDLAPEAYWEYVEEEYDMDVDDVIDYLGDDFIDNMLDTWEDSVGKDVKFSYDITDDDEISDSKLDKIKDVLKENYGIAKKDVDEAIEYEIEVVVKGDDDEEDFEEKVLVVEIDGDWYACTEDGELYADALVSAAVLKKAAEDLEDGLGGLGDLDDLGDLGDLADIFG